jgi:hypothetical protein
MAEGSGPVSSGVVLECQQSVSILPFRPFFFCQNLRCSYWFC